MAATEAILHARALNQRTRSLVLPGSQEPAAFFCECADDHCYAAVWLDAERYDAVEAEQGFVLADGHEPPRLDAELRTRLQQLLLERRSDTGMLQ